MDESSVALNGLLKSDNTVLLEGTPGLPPGPVQVVLKRVRREGYRGTGAAETTPVCCREGGASDRVPDAPLVDQSVPVPFDLPRPGKGEPVPVRQAAGRLPDPPFAEDDDAPGSTRNAIQTA